MPSRSLSSGELARRVAAHVAARGGLDVPVSSALGRTSTACSSARRVFRTMIVVVVRSPQAADDGGWPHREHRASLGRAAVLIAASCCRTRACIAGFSWPSRFPRQRSVRARRGPSRRSPPTGCSSACWRFSVPCEPWSRRVSGPPDAGFSIGLGQLLDVAHHLLTSLFCGLIAALFLVHGFQDWPAGRPAGGGGRHRAAARCRTCGRAGSCPAAGSCTGHTPRRRRPVPGGARRSSRAWHPGRARHRPCRPRRHRYVASPPRDDGRIVKRPATLPAVVSGIRRRAPKAEADANDRIGVLVESDSKRFC